MMELMRSFYERRYDDDYDVRDDIEIRWCGDCRMWVESPKGEPHGEV